MTARPTPPQSAKVEPALYLLPVLAVRVRVAVPHHVARDRHAAAEYTLQLAREHGLRACLVWDRDLAYEVMYSRATDASANAPLALDGVWIERRDGGGDAHARVGGRPAVLTFE